MRELTLTEIDNVSGADLGSRLSAAIVGSVAAFFAGSIW
ncbi:colicin V synthesis protein, partial [Xylella fastidiosa subsp. multiplex]|nr:colicin V synthesis protein [Xylella fastidiosa subsp. multiplex]